MRKNGLVYIDEEFGKKLLGKILYIIDHESVVISDIGSRYVDYEFGPLKIKVSVCSVSASYKDMMIYNNKYPEGNMLRQRVLEKAKMIGGRTKRFSGMSEEEGIKEFEEYFNSIL